MLEKNLLTGNLVRLAALDPEIDGPLWAKWSENSEYGRLKDSEPAELKSPAATRDWIIRHLDDWLECEFQIRVIDGDKVIGNIGLEGNMKVHGDAFVGIGIGEPGDRGKGYGTEAMQLILTYAFMELNLYRVSLDVFEYNTRAIRSYEKAGFKVEGRQRGRLLRDSRRWDLIYMGILFPEWFENRHLNSQ